MKRFVGLLLALTIASGNLAAYFIFQPRPVQATSDAFNYFQDAEAIDLAPSTLNSWVAVDVSGYVPYDATGVILQVYNAGISTHNIGLRMYGSTDNRTDDMYTTYHFWAVVGILYSQWLEVYIESADQHIYLGGWTGPGVTFFQDAKPYSLSGINSWLDIDTSTYVPAGAEGLIFEYDNTWTGLANWGLRPNGSANDYKQSLENTGKHLWAIIGCDSGRIVEANVGNTNLKTGWYLTGYVTSGANFYTNATDITPIVDASWENVTLPSSANGAFIMINASTSTEVGLRMDGSSDSITKEVKHNFGLVGSRTQIIEVNNGGASVSKVYVVGYSTGSDAPTPTPSPTPTSSPTPTPTPSAAYTIKLKVTNGCTTTQGASGAPLPLDNTQLVAAGLISDDGLDTSVKESDGTFRQYLLRNSYINIYVPSLAAGASKEYTYYTGYYPPQTYFYFVPGDTGYVTTADDASLEPGASNFTVEWKGYFDATKTGDIAYKDGEYGITVSVAGTVSAFVNAVELTAEVASGEHELLLSRVGATATLYVDDIAEDSDTVVDPSDTAGTITSSENGPAIYTQYTTIGIAAVTVLNYQPFIIIADATLDDSSASGNDGTVTWGIVPVCYIASVGGRSSAPTPTPRPPSQDIILPVGPTPTQPATPRFPLFQVFDDVADIGGLPWQWLVIPFLLLVVILFSFLAYKWTGQLWVSSIVAGLLMCAGIPMGVFPYWIGVLVGIFLGAVVLVKATVLH